MARKPAPDARDHILDVAARLFTEHGVHNVGLQQIIDEFGCGKSLLYREFASKDDLIVAWLERCRGSWDAMVQRTGAEAPDAAAQLVALVDAARAELAAGSPVGCPIRNTRAEFPDPTHPAHQVAVAHLRAMRRDIGQIAATTSAPDPEGLADRIMLIIDGLYTNGLALGLDGAASAAVEFAGDVVRSAVPATPRRRSQRAAH
jgi:AcrR family transcriptional regulator